MKKSFCFGQRGVAGHGVEEHRPRCSSCAGGHLCDEFCGFPGWSLRRIFLRRPGNFQFAQRVPAVLTGMNWLLPMYWSSTAELWLPVSVPLVLVVLWAAAAE